MKLGGTVVRERRNGTNAVSLSSAGREGCIIFASAHRPTKVRSRHGFSSLLSQVGLFFSAAQSCRPKRRRSLSWAPLSVMAAVALAALNASCSKPAEKETFLQLRDDAMRGDAQAQFELGLRYRQGLDVAEDFELAALWFRKSADQGHPVAQFAMGHMCLAGEGMPVPNEAEAAGWFLRSAGQEYAPAQDQMAIMCSNGTGVPQDDAEAVRWATKAAEQGYGEAQFQLGFLLCCKLPRTIPTDNVSAYVWFRLAAKAGQEKAEEFLTTLRNELSPAQVANAEKRIAAWEKSHSQTPGSSGTSIWKGTSAGSVVSRPVNNL